jgi:hypothetical protein
VLAGVAALVARASHGYPWGVLFKHTFVEELVHPASASGAVRVGDYVHVALDSLRYEAATSVFVVYLLVLAIGVAAHLDGGRRLAPADTAGEGARVHGPPALPILGVIGVLFAGAAVRWLVFPAFFDRFFVAHEVIFAALAVRMIQERLAAAPPREETVSTGTPGA